jgi:hypothetical protein
MNYQKVILFTSLIILWGTLPGFSQTFPEIIWYKQAHGSYSELASTDSIRFSADGLFSSLLVLSRDSTL